MLGRSNQDWLEELRGTCGIQSRHLARQALAVYLYDEAHNYLMRRHVSGNPYVLERTELDELAAWPKEVAQERVEKLAGDEFALLEEFEGLLMSEKKPVFCYWAASLVMIEELRGEAGLRRQALALKNLGAYLYDIVYNYLRRRQKQQNPYFLADLAMQELAALSSDCVQKTEQKLIDGDWALFNKFKASGRFSSWLATIAINEAKLVLRRPDWERRDGIQVDGQDSFGVPQEGRRPEDEIMVKELLAGLSECIDSLTDDQRAAIKLRFFENRSGNEAAMILKRTPNAVYSLVRKAKPNLRKCLEKKGWQKDFWNIFNK